MRAMAVTDYRSPLQLVELPDPETPPDSVLVRVLTCGVCFSDVKTSRGHMAFSSSLKLPHVPGHEICGEVVEASRASGFGVGQRVVVYNYWPCGRCVSCRRGMENICEELEGWVGFTTPGGFQEYLAVPVDRLLPLPEGVTPEQGATISCALGTSYRAVVTRARTRAGETVAVLGTGGVGLHALQVVRAAGARAVAVDIDSRKLERAAQLGAAATVLAGAEAEKVVAELTHGVGVDVVISTAGSEQSLDQASRLVRTGGRIVGVGYTVGAFAPIQMDTFVLREFEFIGSRYVQRHELERALHLVAEGQVRPVVDDVLPLEEANKALERLERGEVVGRTVLHVGAYDG